MDVLENLLVVARDAAPFYEYNDQPVVEEYREKQEAHKSAIRACSQGKRHKGVDGGQSVDMDVEEVVPHVKVLEWDALGLEPMPESEAAGVHSDVDSGGESTDGQEPPGADGDAYSTDVSETRLRVHLDYGTHRALCPRCAKSLCLVRTQIVPQILRIQILQVQVLVQIPTPALIPTDEHKMVAPVFVFLHRMSFGAKPQAGGSPFSDPTPPSLFKLSPGCSPPPPIPTTNRMPPPAHPPLPPTFKGQALSNGNATRPPCAAQRKALQARPPRQTSMRETTNNPEPQCQATLAPAPPKKAKKAWKCIVHICVALTDADPPGPVLHGPHQMWWRAPSKFPPSGADWM